jgi:hypothetical protein
MDNFTSFTTQNYPFALVNNANYALLTVNGRMGVCATGAAASTPTWITTNIQYPGIAAVSSDQTGLGLTFIVAPFLGPAGLYTPGAGNKMWVGLNVAQNNYTTGNSLMFLYDYSLVSTNRFCIRMGNAPDVLMPTFAPGDFLVMRIVPLASNLGATFYYTNQTAGGVTTTTTRLYSAQVSTNTDSSTYMYAGMGINNTGSGVIYLAIDYMGIQSGKQRIYT